MKPSTRFRPSAARGAVALVAAAGLSAAATAAFAAEARSVAAEEAAAPTDVQAVAAKGSAISLGACHFQNTPPHDPHRRLECPPGEVVVAVYEQGVRCCSLELR